MRRPLNRRWLFVLTTFVCCAQLAPYSRSIAQDLSVSEHLSPTDWPWWRGPTRDGHANSGALPTSFAGGEKELWRTPVPGRGHGSPIIVGQRVFLSTADEKNQVQSVMAYDLQTGQPLWRQDVNRGKLAKNNHPKNTEASPTLASDGQRLFATFFNHQQIELTVLDLEGATQWKKVTGAFNPTMFEYGYAPSPVLYGNSVIVSAEHDGKSYIAAFNRQTGDELWRTPRLASISFSSPVVAHVSGRDQLLISGQGKVCSYDPSNGKSLWEVEGTTMATCGTMIWNQDMVFASGGYPKAETIAIRGDGSQVVWKNNQKCYEQSMILVDGFIYALTDKGILYCWQASDGAEMWSKRLEGPVSASPVIAGGHIYWANEAGSVYVFKPNSKAMELVSEDRVGTEAFASPAVSGSRIILRIAQGTDAARQEFLICFGT